MDPNFNKLLRDRIFYVVMERGKTPQKLRLIQNVYELLMDPTYVFWYNTLHYRRLRSCVIEKSENFLDQLVVFGEESLQNITDEGGSDSSHSITSSASNSESESKELHQQSVLLQTFIRKCLDHVCCSAKVWCRVRSRYRCCQIRKPLGKDLCKYHYKKKVVALSVFHDATQTLLCSDIQNIVFGYAFTF